MRRDEHEPAPAVSEPDSSTGRRRILLVQFHPIEIAGWAALFDEEGGFHLCGSTDYACAVEQMETFRPDLVVIDVTERQGRAAIKEIRVRRPSQLLLASGSSDDPLYVAEILALGVAGYLKKKEALERIKAAIHRIFAEQRGFSGRRGNTGVNQPGEALVFGGLSPLERLTVKQRTIFSMLGLGATSGEIATQLGLSVKTIQSHYEVIMDKLGLAKMSELRRSAIASSVRQTPPPMA
jgi:two-component system uhpT operon response regulator UhpA